jgi:hypothetical protein
MAMTSIGSSFNWLPQSSAWQDLQNWQARMSAANAQYQSSVQGFDDTLLSAPVTQTGSQLQLVTQEMVNRIQTEQATAAAKAAAEAANGAEDPAVFWGLPVSEDGTDGTTGLDINGLISSLSASVEPDPSLTAADANPAASAQESGVFWGLPSDFDLPAGSNLDITA